VAVVGLGGCGHRQPRVRVQAVELPGDLDEPGPHRARRAVRVVVGPDALGQLGREQRGQPVRYPLHQAGRTVRGLVQAGGGDHVHAAGPRHPGQRVGPAVQPVRRPLHHRAAAERPERRQLGGRRVLVVQLRAGQQRRPEEQVVVGVADAHLGGCDVAQNGADHGCHAGRIEG
jgi:hypothetical protein